MMMNSRRKSRASSSIIGGNPDTEPVVLLIIDPQIDFHEGGSLAVSSDYFVIIHACILILIMCIYIRK